MATKPKAAATTEKKLPKKTGITIVVKGATVAYGYLHKRDTEGQYADDKFKANFVLPGDYDTADIDAKVAEVCALDSVGWTGKTVKPPYKAGNEDKEEFADKLIIIAKTQYEPDLRTADKKKLPEGVQIRSGDVVNFIAELIPHTAGGPKQVAGRLLAVQLIKKNAGSANGGDGFDEEEGYSAADAPSTTSGDSDDGDGDGDEF